jgi:flagellar biosynthetic protein FliP
MNPLARLLLVVLIAVGLRGAPALAQPQYGPSPSDVASSLDDTGELRQRLNPIELLDAAGSALPGSGPDGSGESGGISTAMSIMVLLTVIAVVPSIMLMTTCFLRIMIVLALLRQAMGAAGIPPPQVMTALALFMTLMVMSPTLERVWDEAVMPYQAGEITDYDELWRAGSQPLRDFMFGQIEATGNWSSLYMVLEYQGIDISDPSRLTRADVTTTALVPAYMLSELKTAFVMGFKVYLPFLVIDMVIASVLISMSMMMLPPVLISLPFKLLLFILVDGWTLIIGGLLYSFVPDGSAHAAAIIDSGSVLAHEAMRVALLR